MPSPPPAGTPSSSINSQVLRTAAAVMSDLDIRYMEADFDGKVQLKPELDKATLAFSKLRLKLLQNAVLCKPGDVQNMQTLRQEIGKASSMTTLLQVAVRISSFFLKL
jgi:hypothetical protein